MKHSLPATIARESQDAWRTLTWTPTSWARMLRLHRMAWCAALFLTLSCSATWISSRRKTQVVKWFLSTAWRTNFKLSEHSKNMHLLCICLPYVALSHASRFLWLLGRPMCDQASHVAPNYRLLADDSRN